MLGGNGQASSGMLGVAELTASHFCSQLVATLLGGVPKHNMEVDMGNSYI
jgi:hypothetical protein